MNEVSRTHLSPEQLDVLLSWMAERLSTVPGISLQCSTAPPPMAFPAGTWM
ncbi:MAG: hypothetical protein NZ769_07180 [Anaerolineae bacterium]|nr:hypothetical protein [Anaerolineae bacterium]